jgi:hypothetical protein
VEDGIIRRVPDAVAKSVNHATPSLSQHTAGGRIRFKTDSSFVMIRYKVPYVTHFGHMAPTGVFGFDLYKNEFEGEGERYVSPFVPSYDLKDTQEGVLRLWSNKMRQLTLNMPLYNPVSELYIGLEEGAQLLPADPYPIEKPVVFYGSSITQGGCASRPGTCYTAVLSRKMNFEHINLGFSGNARGEQAMAEYIASMDMSAFVLDYDHNSNSAEHLSSTHYAFYRTVRDAHPDLPIIMVSRPKYHLNSTELAMREVIKESYARAISEGDRKVWFVDGKAIMPRDVAGDALVDYAHPTDLGFYFMAKALEPVLREALGMF